MVRSLLNDIKRVKDLGVCAILVSFVGLLVMYGWLMDIPILKTIIPGAVTMKFSTALCFFFSGIITGVTNLERGRLSHKSEVIVSACSFAMLFLMLGMLVEELSGTSMGLDNLFIMESPEEARYSVSPGVPSLGTIISFLLLSTSGIVTGKHYIGPLQATP